MPTNCTLHSLFWFSCCDLYTNMLLYDIVTLGIDMYTCKSIFKLNQGIFLYGAPIILSSFYIST